MCRLLAIISKEKTDANHWFFESNPAFKEFSEKVICKAEGPHNDGWGIGWFENNKWNLFKQGEEQKPYNFNAVKKAESSIILIHLRRASSGDKSAKNAHPFAYNNWIFEHNGGIDLEKVRKHLNKKFSKELGDGTDSKCFFMLIMQLFEESKDIISSIKKALEIIKKYDHRGLNFILSDGEKLYVFRGVSPKLKNKYDYYSLNYIKTPGQVIISSNPLSKDKWVPLELRELLVIDKMMKIEKN